MHLSIVSPTTPSPYGKELGIIGAIVITLFDLEIPPLVENLSSTHFLTHAVGISIKNSNSYRSIQPVDSILKPIIIFYTFIQTVAIIQQIISRHSSWGLLAGMKSCLRGGEFDRWARSNRLLSSPIPIQGVVGLTIDTCITRKIRGKGWVRLLHAFAVF